MQFKRYSSDAVTPDAQYDLGDAHYYGQGVPSDYAEAVKRNSKAAEQGHSEAESRVAGRTGAAKESLRTTLNRRGGFAKPLSRAMHAPSASSVLYNGQGVPHDYAEAAIKDKLTDQLVDGAQYEKLGQYETEPVRDGGRSLVGPPG
jgi:hypothetical protein